MAKHVAEAWKLLEQRFWDRRRGQGRCAAARDLVAPV
jgi:hypothetical protein